MIVVDRGGVIRYWSEDAERLTGHRAPDAVGQTLDLVVPPEYRPRHWAGFEAAMQTGTARAEGAAANIPVLCADGTIRRWPARFTLIRDARGRPAGAAAVMVEPLPDDPAFFEL
jgi:PAS domain S-box-containing protein